MRKPLLRCALFGSAFSLLMFGLVTGCGGGSSSDSDLSSTRANISFSDASSTVADTSDLNASGSEPVVDEDTTGVHAGFVEENGEYHILVLDSENNPRRTLNLTIYTENPDAPIEGEELDIEENDEFLQMSYIESNGVTRFWEAVSGSITVDEVTNDAYRIRLNDVVFELESEENGPPVIISQITPGPTASPSPTISPTANPEDDNFTLDGTVVIQKDDITAEEDETFHEHEYGFGFEFFQFGLSKSAPATHKKVENPKW